MAIKCPNRSLSWTFKSVMTKVSSFWALKMVTSSSFIIKTYSPLIPSRHKPNAYQISLTYQSDIIWEFIKMKFVNLNGILTINTLSLEEKKGIVYFGNIKIKKLQSFSKISKSQSCSIVEKKELLDAILSFLTALILISSLGLCN